MLATAALFVLGAWTLFALTFDCCSSRSPGEGLGDPWGLCMLLSFPTPLAALPPLSRRLRGTQLRWALVPSLLAAGATSLQLARAVDTGAPLDPSLSWRLLLTVVPLAVCALYALARVVLAPADVSA